MALEISMVDTPYFYIAGYATEVIVKYKKTFLKNLAISDVTFNHLRSFGILRVTHAAQVYFH